MLQRLCDTLRVYYRSLQWDRLFGRWQLDNPGGSFAQFYADDARRRIGQQGQQPHAVGRHLDPNRQRARSESLLGYLKWAGLRPQHLLVDFGCGSLWIGETLMTYLQPGRYVALDVVDYFHSEGLQRLGADFVLRHQPGFELVSPAALARIGARRPDFIISTAVLRHVRPREVGEYFSQIISLATPTTRIIIGHKCPSWTRVRGARSLEYDQDVIRAALDGLGYEPRFERMPGSPACQIALFEIVPKADAGRPGS